MNPSDELSAEDLIKQILRRAIFFGVGLGLLLAVVGYTGLAKGLALGTLASAGNFLLMAWLLPRAVQTGRGKAEAVSFMSLALRFALMGGALFLAFYLFGKPGIGGAALGLFSVQASILAGRWTGRPGRA